MDRTATQRDFAVQVVRQLREANFEAYWAGGCVRDQLRGDSPKDYDVATSALPDQVRALFGKRRTLAIGAAFGVIGVLGGKSLDPIEVATFRSDGNYLDGRHPEAVTFSTPEHDAQRRDFTINGLFYDPLDDKIIDFVGGRNDLRNQIVRAIGNPHERFTEDKLRMLRAVRFASTLDFQLEASTLAAVQEMADEVAVVSAERINAELSCMLVGPGRSRALQLLQESLLLEQLIPTLATVAAQDLPAWQRLLDQLDALSEPSLPVVLAALWLSTPAPQDAGPWTRQYRFTNKQTEHTLWLIEHLNRVEQAASVPWPVLQRVLIHDHVNDLLVLADALIGQDHPSLTECRRRRALPASELNPPLLLTGQDLIAHGVSPGPNFKPILDHVRDQQLLGHIHDRSQALAEVDAWLQQHR